MEKQSFKSFSKLITVDNGVEFLDQQGVEKSIFNCIKRTRLYFAHAFCSCERGSNENANKLIRRWIPKGSDISKYSNNKIKQIENWINNYPRRLFKGLTSNEMEQMSLAI